MNANDYAFKGFRILIAINFCFNEFFTFHFVKKMRFRREPLLGAEAPKIFHALRGRRIFLAEPPP